MKKTGMILFVLLLIGQPAAMAYEWQLDRSHSGIMFEIKHIYSAVRGNFNDFSGNVFFDPSQPENSRADFTVQVDSIYTGIAKRDNHLRSGDFFDANKFPQMTFKSTRVTHKEGNRYAFEGQMTVKDVTQKMDLEFVYLGEKENHDYYSEDGVRPGTWCYRRPEAFPWSIIGDGLSFPKRCTGNWMLARPAGFRLWPRRAPSCSKSP